MALRTATMMRRMAFLAGIVLLILYHTYLGRTIISSVSWPPLRHPDISSESKPSPTPTGSHSGDKSKHPSLSAGSHPIEFLAQSAETEFTTLLSKGASNLKSAAASYRERRGRHPPPGFDAWFTFAQNHNSLIVEDFFDQIYHDITPLWGLPPAQMRRDVRGSENLIHIRKGNATKVGEFWRMGTWNNMIGEIAKYLPDMDIAFNAMDEPRLSVGWEDIERYVRTETEGRKVIGVSEVVSEYSGVIQGEDDATPPEEFNWTSSVPYYSLARQACPPKSLSRLASLLPTFSQTPIIDLNNILPHAYKGYVSNYTLSNSICHQPDLQGLHGALISPVSIKSSSRLFPLFGGSKLTTNNEILLPAPIYWEDDPRYAANDSREGAWGKKVPKIVWRGVASGGRNTQDNWKAFHRHRFVAMMNASQVRRVENWAETPLNWARPADTYDLTALKAGRLGDWIATFADVTFTGLPCPDREDEVCPHTTPHFSTAAATPFAEQFQSKYLIDIDGNSFSGRYRSFLLSSSMPIKATLFREWHDSRLVPWRHFVPMDNRYGDLLGIMEYFLGVDEEILSGKPGVKGRDDVARMIAEEGMDWAEKVLRKEDMLVYTLRLLLEYARVIDDRREKLGFVGDL
ncbi:MAG: hypothetical protein M1813_008864 [Trichoglossum hirsutum]|nr:MAG: hypothetical protein M1813_008864 [Trichoglossum hirsutum]